MPLENAAAWAQELFGSAALGDPRRTRRLVEVTTAFGEGPGGSLATTFAHSLTQRAGAYRLMNNANVQSQALVDAAGQATARTIGGQDELLFLALCDSTTLGFSHATVRKDLGPLTTNANAKTQGFWVHSVLLISPDNCPVGLLHQDYWIRDRKTHGKRRQRSSRPYESKESYKWEKAIRAADARLTSEDRSKVLYVCDREAEVFEFFQYLKQTNKRFVVRVTGQRKVLDAEAALLREVAEAGEVVGSQSVAIPQRGGRRARVAEVQLRSGSIILQPPKRFGSQTKGLELNYVLASEAESDSDSSGLNWLLVTSEPVVEEEQLSVVLESYRSRWTIEEFHKVWKSGTKVEEQRLESTAGLQRLSVVLAQVAVRMMRLRVVSEQTPSAACTQVLDELECRCLVMWAASQPKLAAPADQPPSMRWAYHTLGRMGGWYDSKRTGRVGVQAFWRGWMRLEQLKQAFLLFQSAEKNGELV